MLNQRPCFLNRQPRAMPPYSGLRPHSTPAARDPLSGNSFIQRLGKLLLGLCAALVVASCANVPVTDRNQLNLVSSSQLQAMSNEQFQAYLAEHERSDNQTWSNTVESVGRDIARSVEQYLTEIDRGQRVTGFEWQFVLVESEEKNAFAMPGGKVVVYEGIMQMINGDSAELATVMSHEIAHVVAQHGNERMSQQLLTQVGGAAVSAAVDGESALQQNLFMTAYGLGTQVGVLLPYSRTHESEADEMGLIFMAKAGYDPRAAIDFWQKMHNKSGDASPPELLSTHPAPENRISDIRDQLPEVLPYYRNNQNVSSL